MFLSVLSICCCCMLSMLLLYAVNIYWQQLELRNRAQTRKKTHMVGVNSTTHAVTSWKHVTKASQMSIEIRLLMINNIVNILMIYTVRERSYRNLLLSITNCWIDFGCIVYTKWIVKCIKLFWNRDEWVRY